MRPLPYNIILLFFMLTASYGLAQQKLYSFSLKQTGQFLTYKQGALVLADARTGVNQQAQRFIVKRLDSGKTLIAPAAKPGLFLKRDGAGIILAAYTGGDTTFEWYLQYSGYPYASIIAPGTTDALSWQSGSGFSMQDISPGLIHNDDTAGNHYRFSVANVINTF